ncbi:hypothetical protein KAFR_0A06200 [Kazachstania africana CBS 2517]|uniref:Uncharacterized protein n=1 Tax=Kazachstania africana (strain ATCC 22294 / BCRC 22015 / CBS 2517 / CECT 1963 / NBRC 1671 / NRRL Y-8276) TaxID=1071382 RepID=H2ANV5_KAZAF|nr:hypothetical protein KAFR_0A06200 [Kazachstania africana CBS 2517]CCF56055.1 hypothetical protein KAFR_0A06200 [Kazachstania africana CBS 2517]
MTERNHATNTKGSAPLLGDKYKLSQEEMEEFEKNFDGNVKLNRGGKTKIVPLDQLRKPHSLTHSAQFKQQHPDISGASSSSSSSSSSKKDNSGGLVLNDGHRPEGKQ